MKNNWPTQTIFTYHEVLPDSAISRYAVSTDQFESHLKLFRQLGEQFSCRPRLSFDDGHASNYLYAAPLLSRHGVLATFFVTTGFVSCRTSHMGWSDVRSLLAAGHEVQAHGYSHRFLPECSDSELVHELVDAKNDLEDRIGRPVTEMSLPGGRYDDRVLRFIAKAGYRKVYSSDPFSQRPVTGSLELEGRVMVRRDTSAFHLQGLARRTTLARAVVHAESMARSGLRTMLGTNKYHAVWSKASGRQTQPAASNEEYQASRH